MLAVSLLAASVLLTPAQFMSAVTEMNGKTLQATPALPEGVSRTIHVEGYTQLILRTQRMKDGVSETTAEQGYRFTTLPGARPGEHLVEATMAPSGRPPMKTDCSARFDSPEGSSYTKIALDCYRPGEMRKPDATPMATSNWMMTENALSIDTGKIRFEVLRPAARAPQNDWFKRFVSKVAGYQSAKLSVQMQEAPGQWLLAPADTTARLQAEGTMVAVEYLVGGQPQTYRLSLLPEWHSRLDPSLVFLKYEAPDGKARICTVQFRQRNPFELFEPFLVVGDCHTGLTEKAAGTQQLQLLGKLLSLPEGVAVDGHLHIHITAERFQYSVEPGLAALQQKPLRLDSQGAAP